MLNDFAFPGITNAYRADYQADDALHNVWWFQDGAPAHRLRAVRDRLTLTFGDRLVALGTEIEWPARFPDLNPLDFFLWGYLKSKVTELLQQIWLSCEEELSTNLTSCDKSDKTNSTLSIR